MAIRIVKASSGVEEYAIGTDNILMSDEEGANAANDWVKVKEIRLYNNGDLKIHFQIKSTEADVAQYGRIYKNGVAVGTERSNDTTSYVLYTEDIAGWEVDDLLQLYVKKGLSGLMYYKRLRISSSTRQTGADILMDSA